MWVPRKQVGFTIVEILIVIVIIAILAAVSIVLYSGFQQRANNVSRISNASAAVKLIRAYMTTYSTYPSVAANSCVGNGFANGNQYCWGSNSATPAVRSSSFNEELSKIGSLPHNSTPVVVTPSWEALGPVYLYSTAYTVDGASNRVLVLYFLEGANQDCGMSGVVRNTSGNAYESVTSSPRNSVTLGNSTHCFVAIPNPS
jgi:prepilin-type N-terminal cleavage/methylation domain-containing protein